MDKKDVIKEVFGEETVLVQYNRDSKNNVNGVVIAIGNEVIGWSLCNKKDKFNKKRGLIIAFGRAIDYITMNKVEQDEYLGDIPNSLQDLVEIMYDRSRLYFKEEENDNN